MKTTFLLALTAFFATPLLAQVAQEAAQPVNLFPEGSFEILDDKGAPEGWKLMHPNYLAGFKASISLQEEVVDGQENQFLRIVNPDPQKSVWVEAKLPVQTGALRVKARFRVTDLKVNPEKDWFSAQWDAQWKDAEGKTLSHVGTQMRFKADTDGWTTREQVIRPPVGATSLFMNPGLWGATGTLDLDDVQIFAE